MGIPAGDVADPMTNASLSVLPMPDSGFDAVAFDLLLQLIDAVELLLTACVLDEINADLLAVDIL